MCQADCDADGDANIHQTGHRLEHRRPAAPRRDEGVGRDAERQAWTTAKGERSARSLFGKAFGGHPDGVWASPGRVNLVGEHTDYNGGLCLPIALPHRTYAAVRRRDDERVRMISGLDDGDLWVGSLDDLAPNRVEGWVAYCGGRLRWRS